MHVLTQKAVRRNIINIMLITALSERQFRSGELVQIHMHDCQLQHCSRHQVTATPHNTGTADIQQQLLDAKSR